MPDIEIGSLRWDDWNRDHCAKHGISVSEIEALLTGSVFGRETYKGRYQVFRTDTQGRILSFVIGADPDRPDVWYVFSARPASRRERRRYGFQPESDKP
jgi:uncharacterized DUF497 family protein